MMAGFKHSRSTGGKIGISSMEDSSLSSQPSQLRPQHERKESELWRWILLFMVLLAAAFAGLAWERLVALPYHLGPVAVGVLALSSLLAAYAFAQRRAGTLLEGKERRELERKMALQEEFRRRLLESFPDLILVIDLDERYTFVSSRVRDLLGCESEDLLGKKMGETEPSSAEMVRLYREVVGGEENFKSAEYGVRHRDGSDRTMRASASRFFDADSKLAGAIISVRDITMEKKFEQQVIQSERLAAMGAMIGGVAHELNNPLTSILGFSQLLQESQATDSARKQMATLEQEARRAAEIVRNLTYFATPPTPGKTRVNLGDVVERTLNLRAYSLRKSGITVDFARENGLASAEGDPHQLMQVFLNLTLNAEQAIREQHERGTLRIRMGSNGDSVWVSFQDDGPGIPPEILGSIFDPFYTTKRPGRGTGLGLSICKAVMKEHNGTIEAANVADGGAVFTVTVPAAGA